jgi:hypothetical protein
MEWIVHHWPTLWTLYDPVAIRVLIAVSLAVLFAPAQFPAAFDVNQVRNGPAP